MIIRLYDQNSYLSATDINRIEENMQTCYGLVFDKSIQETSVKTFSDILTPGVLNRIESTILEMQMASQSMGVYEKPKTDWKVGDSISYLDLNRIEQNLKFIYEFYSESSAEVLYPGDNKYLAQQFI